MTTSPIAATAGAARQRLASSLASLQQDPNLPADVLELVSGLARAMGPLFQVERGTGDPSLLFTARAVLQETLGKMQTVDQSVVGVPDATAAIAQSLGMIFSAIREHHIADPAAQPAPVPQPAPVVQPAPAPQPAPPAAQPLVAQPPPVLLVQPAPQPMPLVQPAAQPIPLVQSSPSVPRETAGAPVPAVPRVHSVIPETAAKVPVGPNGLPRIEVELDVHSDSNFYTDFLGDIRNHGGIFVATFSLLSANTLCEVLISFPGALTAEVRGIVKWKREPKGDSATIPGLGVEITHASPDAWKLIDRFIKNREPIIHEV